MRIFLLFFYLLLIVFSLAFAALNSTLVTVSLYWMTAQLPLAFVMIVCIGLVLILGALLFMGKYWMLRFRLNKVKHQVTILEQEIKNLRTIPITDPH